ncbi:MAG: hypothetical protein ACJAZP_002757 [Psychromonas sp.]|jgi:hypothetical protein|uniref:cytochrome b/b6 domain-containing protein n=1 Tax=Psychromonas sp. TaxID=1884585 RepID=UPI0039E5CFB7
MKIYNTVMDYMREHQTPLIRTLHMTIIFLVLSQIIVSNFMDVNRAGEISTNTVEFYGTWLHIILGISLFPVAIIFLTVELKRHGLKYYFPYLWREFTQLRNDISLLLKFKLPESSPYGLVAIIQGLGLGALFLVLFSGFLWFITWYVGLSWSYNLKDLHELFTGLIQAYLIGHGAMGVLHIYLYARAQKNG